MLHVVDLHYVSICGGRWCPFGHTLPTLKDTHTGKESKLHNAWAPYPRAGLGSLRFSHFTTGRPGPDMAFNVRNGEGLYPHPDVVSPAVLGGLYMYFPETTLFSEILKTLKKIKRLLRRPFTTRNIRLNTRHDVLTRTRQTSIERQSRKTLVY
jgi:hypothetical protein